MTPQPAPEDLSHAMLVAVLMHHGGSVTVPVTAFEADSIGGPNGAFHVVAMEPISETEVRLTVRPRPEGETGGVSYEPYNG